VLAAAVVLAGCGDSADTASSEKDKPATTTSATASSKPAPRYTVEQLAAKLGCTAGFRGPTKGFRQGSCTKDGKSFVLLDFTSAENQRLWLDDAISFGGIYLVGDRWALSGVSKQYMQSLSKTFGGTVEDRHSRGS
jgi:hypothetical protein